MEQTSQNATAINTIRISPSLSAEHTRLLLDTIKTLALAKNRADILSIIDDRIRPILHFHNYCLLITDQHNDVDSFVCYSHDYISKSNPRPDEKKIYEHDDITYVHQFLDSLILRAEKGPLIIDHITDDLYRGNGKTAAMLKAKGGRKGLIELLKANGKVFGCIILNFHDDSDLTNQNITLFQAITEQLSIALDNIISNEKILYKARDLNKLLHLIEDMVSIRQREDLGKVIKEKIKPILDFDDGSIIIFDKCKRHCKPFLNIASDERKSHPLYSQIMERERWPLEGSPAQQISNDPEDILYFNVVDCLLRYPEYPPFLLMQQTGLHHSLSVKLWWGGDLIGLFMLHFGQRSPIDELNYHLIKAVGNQVAVAVANIMATEEILRREKEKAALLSISEAINSIRKKEDLLRVISEKIKPLFTFNDVVIALVNPDNNTHRAFLLHTDSRRHQHTDFKPTSERDYPVDDGVFDQALKAGSPVVLNVKDAIGKFPAACYLKFIYESGIREIVSTPIRYSPDVTGVLILQSEKMGSFYCEKDFNLLQAVADQLAIAVANILITEEMICREQEKSIQLSIIQHLTNSLSWEQWFGLIAQELQKKIPFRFAYFSCAAMENEQRYGYGYQCINKDEYQYVNKDHLLRILHMDDARFLQLTKDAHHIVNPPINEEKGIHENEAFPIIPLITKGMNMGSHLSFSHTFAEYGLFYICLFNVEKDSYHEKDKASFHNIMSGIMPNIEKNRHSDEIIRLKEKLEHEKIYLADEIKSTHNFDEIIGSSAVMADVYKKVNQAAKTDVTILITGETGTGKELLARAIHNYSDRKKNVMVKINCAVLPAQLIESELFGHEKGAFTGAIERRLGKFEIANGSTLFLDEIGELPLELQAKLLRVLQEKEFERLGSNKVIKTDVRIVAATNRNLEKEVMEGRFRSDLYYRLSIFPVELPPLSERKEDIPLLIRHFIDKYNRKFNKVVAGFSNDLMNEILQSPWPGNIREMEHLVERAVMLCDGKIITNLYQNKKYLRNPLGAHQPNVPIKSLAQSEKEHILNILKITNGRIRGEGGAAELLNIKPTTLEARMKKHGVEKKFTG